MSRALLARIRKLERDRGTQYRTLVQEMQLARLLARAQDPHAVYGVDGTLTEADAKRRDELLAIPRDPTIARALEAAHALRHRPESR